MRWAFKYRYCFFVAFQGQITQVRHVVSRLLCGTLKICPAFLNALHQDTCKHLLRRHGQVSVKVFDYLAKQVAIVIPLTAPSMRRTRCKRKVEVLALFNQFLS